MAQMPERILNTLQFLCYNYKKHHFSALRERMRMQTANEKVLENFRFETLNIHGTPDNQTDVRVDLKRLHTTTQ